MNSSIKKSESEQLKRIQAIVQEAIEEEKKGQWKYLGTRQII